MEGLSNILLSMVVQQLLVILVFSQEKMSVHPSAPPSWRIRSDRVPEELWMKVHNTVQEVVTKTIPMKKKCNKANELSEEVLQIAEKIRHTKGKGERERCIQLNVEFQRRARRDKKAFLNEQCKEIEENNRVEKPRDLSRKLEISREHFMQGWAQKTETARTQQKGKRLRRGGKNTQRNCTQKLFMTQIITMV